MTRGDPFETTYSTVRQKLARLMDKASNGREVVFINRGSQKGRTQRGALVAAGYYPR
jgi:PHD/YefM family antitoxin component YafN of YafNO toxin-antitoxin module